MTIDKGLVILSEIQELAADLLCGSALKLEGK
jgi:hypothetical protein